MTNKLFDGIDALPFAGKFLTKGVTMDYVEAGKETDTKKFVIAIGVLGAFAVGHALQARMGIDAIGHNIEYANGSGDGLNVGLSTLEATYAGINAAVTLREIDLMRRLVDIRKKKRRSHADGHSGIDKTPDHRKSSNIFRNPSPLRTVGTAAAVTLAGQAATLGAMHVSDEYHSETPVIEHVVEKPTLSQDNVYPTDESIAADYSADDLTIKIPTDTHSVHITR